MTINIDEFRVEKHEHGNVTARIHVREYPEGMDELIGHCCARDNSGWNSWIGMPVVEAEEAGKGAEGEFYTETMRDAKYLTFRLPSHGGKYGYHIVNEDGEVTMRFYFRKHNGGGFTPEYIIETMPMPQ